MLRRGGRPGWGLGGAGVEQIRDRLGGPGPLVRVTDARVRRRNSDSSSSTASWRARAHDPAFGNERPGGRPSRWSIRAFGSVFGRLHGVGVASVISSSSSAEGAAKQIDWKGDHNLFAGWKGFFACGNDPRSPCRAWPRSVPRGTGQTGKPGDLSPWPHPSDLAAVTPEELEPFVPSRREDLVASGPAAAGLFQKAVGEYPSPAIPQPAGWAFERSAPSRKSLP